jgi:FkbM family methyltransferase
MARAQSFVERMWERMFWIVGTVQQGAGIAAQVKLLLGGIWFLINDAWKSSLCFTARIEQFGRSLPFEFADLGDYGLVHEIFLSDAYDRPLPHTVHTVFDLGANVGVSALYFRLRHPDAIIHCFEPDPDNVARLQRNADLLSQTHVHDFAVWSARETLTFYVDPHRGSSSSAFAVRSRQNAVSVEACTLTDAFDEAGVEQVGLLKVDVEGAEEEVLTAFDDYDRIRALHGEVHGDRCDAEAVLQTVKVNFDCVDVTPMDLDARWYVAAYQDGR